MCSLNRLFFDCSSLFVYLFVCCAYLDPHRALEYCCCCCCCRSVGLCKHRAMVEPITPHITRSNICLLFFYAMFNVKWVKQKVETFYKYVYVCGSSTYLGRSRQRKRKQKRCKSNKLHCIHHFDIISFVVFILSILPTAHSPLTRFCRFRIRKSWFIWRYHVTRARYTHMHSHSQPHTFSINSNLFIESTFVSRFVCLISFVRALIYTETITYSGCHGMRIILPVVCVCWREFLRIYNMCMSMRSLA